MQGKFSGIKLYKFSTLMINARKPKPSVCSELFDLSEAEKNNK